ncbi:MBL fold metallo-hydrolase [Vagococcus salmoninarum]|uniref:MBL fold metallo-hydrolase n=3 Tax=Vagococcus salmoninarum TaxID=2739 RepID=A0A429ZQ77_9ENTE|nr:MBL fold metallo-hydrolase [Vagococcus salmoninarum]MBE9390299.1 MBL fold metallo-hydrolase [Vagococcus salmoninarum]RST95789.1 MBL fold metallo-hydrolase [Vagococcus salmoninarum]
MKSEEAFKVSILASGSTGNSLYIESEKKKILVDAGLSGKKITSLMAEVGRTPADLDAILVTHEHTDHIHGVGVLSRKHNIDVYANEKTWQAMAKNLGKISPEHQHIFEMGKTLTFGDMDIESFGVSHDAADPQFYQFHRNNKAFAILTDTGYCSDRIRGTIKNADGYLMESNHDLSMLRMGNYPWSLKQRILGDQGHLSNEDGALVMADLIGNKTKRIYLGHLSRENNIKELAHMTMENVLRENGLGVGKDFMVYDTDPDQASSLFAI